jgi:DNA-binding NtrC family response regulator
MISSVVVLNGKHTGHTVELDPTSTVTLGRHSSRDIALDDEQASRLHARISYRAEHWHLEDCDSTNGTFVNSQPVHQVILESGDLIRIGSRLILVIDSAQDASPSQVRPGDLCAAELPEDIGPATVVPTSAIESTSRVVRDSVVLCRLADALHGCSDSSELLELSLAALIDGLDADAVSIWTVGADGRLRCACRVGKPHEEHVLASLAVENRKPMLLSAPEHPNAPREDVGRAMGVPILAQQGSRGAIECHRQPNRRPFIRSDLDFTAVVAHQAGAALENLKHRERLEQANVELRRRLDDQSRMEGDSEVMQDVLDQISRVGPTGSNVLILGESGTGKELVASSIHELSQYSAGPYVTVNCAAFSESLLESELFGHEIGAFTGADRRYVGQFERAHRGTIFLDEVGEMSLACQAKLLRLLEGHPYQRLGGEESIQVDVRLVAATHRDLLDLVRQKLFREDLYFRLRVIDINMPPLRERGEDIVTLASSFLSKFQHQMGRGPSRFSPEAIKSIRNYPWPGNVRELKNAVERAIVLGRGDEVTSGDLGLSAQRSAFAQQPQLISLRESEQRHIEYVLEQVAGNKTKAGKILGIGRGTLYNKLEEFKRGE